MSAYNPPAFPVAPILPGIREGSDGMTLRDWFASQALSSVMHLCAKDALAPGEAIEAAFARKSFDIADAMLAARAKS